MTITCHARNRLSFFSVVVSWMFLDMAALKTKADEIFFFFEYHRLSCGESQILLSHFNCLARKCQLSSVDNFKRYIVCIGITKCIRLLWKLALHHCNRDSHFNGHRNEAIHSIIHFFLPSLNWSHRFLLQIGFVF